MMMGLCDSLTKPPILYNDFVSVPVDKTKYEIDFEIHCCLIVVEKWQHQKINSYNVWGSGRGGDVVYQLFRLVIDCKGKDKSSSY